MRRVLAAVLLFAAQQAFAQWSSVGPGGGYVNALAARPDRPQTMFAATGGGVYSTSDGGSTWRSSGQGIAVPYVASLAIDPQRPDTIYAGTAAGVFRSIDAGQTWQPRGLTGWYITSFAIDPRNPATVFAAANGAVFRSDDGGAGWRTVLAEKLNCFSLALDPVSGSLYAGTKGIRKSVDGGTTWTNVSGGITSLALSLAVDRNDSSRVYAGTTDGFYYSSDAGVHWTQSYSGGGTVDSITDDASTAGVIYVAVDGYGIWRSSDGGVTFKDVSGNLAEKSARAVLKISGGLYAGTLRGVYRSSDSATWAASNVGLTNDNVSALAIDAEHPSTIYATGFEFHRSLDSGQTWTSFAVAPSTFISSLAVPRQSPATLYAGTEGAGMFRSRDGGQTWSPINQGLSDRFVFAIAIDPADPNTMYAGTASGSGVWTSSDGGDHWAIAGTGVPSNVYALAIDPITTSTIYACASPGGVYKSIDRGTTWKQLEGVAKLAIYSIAIDPRSPQTIYAGTLYRGITISRDGGATWTNGGGVTSFQPVQASDLTGTVLSIAVDPANSDVIYAGADAGGIYRSSDRGSTWQPFSDGMQPGLSIYAIAIAPGGTPLYAGSGTGGVFRRTFARRRTVSH